MSHIANQIVTVCALLVNFQPVLIPLSTMEESDVDEYLDCYYKSNSDKTDSEQYIHSTIRVPTFNTSYYYIKIIVTQEGHAPAYLKHGLVKPPRELNSYQKINQFRQQFILPE